MIIIGEKLNGSIPSVAKAIAEKNGQFIRDLCAGSDILYYYGPGTITYIGCVLWNL